MTIGYHPTGAVAAQVALQVCWQSDLSSGPPLIDVEQTSAVVVMPIVAEFAAKSAQLLNMPSDSCATLALSSTQLAVADVASAAVVAVMTVLRAGQYCANNVAAG